VQTAACSEKKRFSAKIHFEHQIKSTKQNKTTYTLRKRRQVQCARLAQSRDLRKMFCRQASLQQKPFFSQIAKLADFRWIRQCDVSLLVRVVRQIEQRQRKIVTQTLNKSFLKQKKKHKDIKKYKFLFFFSSLCLLPPLLKHSSHNLFFS
jgi:hypothetical protein